LIAIFYFYSIGLDPSTNRVPNNRYNLHDNFYGTKDVTAFLQKSTCYLT